MEDFVEFKRRIRPKLLEKIENLMFKERYGMDVDDLPEITDEDAHDFVRKYSELDEYYRKNGLEKMVYALNEHMAVMEDTVIRMGECFLQMQIKETLEGYLDSLKRLNCSMECAALCIQAYKEDKKNG
jgi:hypothetical protein